MFGVNLAKLLSGAPSVEMIGEFCSQMRMEVNSQPVADKPAKFRSMGRLRRIHQPGS
jgi:hypothetical protein